MRLYAHLIAVTVVLVLGIVTIKLFPKKERQRVNQNGDIVRDVTEDFYD
jgi:hypothetical protein